MDFYYYMDLLCYKLNKEIRAQVTVLDEAGL